MPKITDDDADPKWRVATDYGTHRCPECSILFFLSRIDLELRKRVGRSWFCPNGHEIKPDEKGVEAGLRWQLEEALRGWEEQRDTLQGEIILLNRELARYKNTEREAERRAEDEAIEAEIEALKVSNVVPISDPPPATDASTLPADEADESASKEVAPTKPGPPPDVAQLARPSTDVSSVEAVKDAKSVESVNGGVSAAKSLQAAVAAPEQPPTWRDTAEHKTCPNCGDEFGPGPKHTKALWENVIRYCGPKCQIEAGNRRAKEKQAAERIRKQAVSEPSAVSKPLPTDAASDSSATAEHDKPLLEPSPIIHLEPMDVVDPTPIEATLASPAPAATETSEVKDSRVNRPVRPVKLPSTASVARAPVPPPSLQAKLPDPKGASDYAPIQPGRVIERGDFGTCLNEGCGRPLNAFGVCPPCKQREKWLEGQRISRINQARGVS